MDQFLSETLRVLKCLVSIALDKLQQRHMEDTACASPLCTVIYTRTTAANTFLVCFFQELNLLE